jgi:D-glycero-D-manno-heptose 1,7-bisphosphate phosphatase
MKTLNRAVLLDRDGTLIEPRHYPSRPEELVIYAGLVHELRQLRAAGFRLGLITNQSGLARGYFQQADLDRMHSHLTTELHHAGVDLDGIFFCPHHPDGTVPNFAIECDCRKPKPGMLRQAAAELDLDLGRSWFIGDILDDVEAGNSAGCRTVLVDLGTERVPEQLLRQPAYVARDSVHALRIIQAVEGIVTGIDLNYRPAQWKEGTGTGEAIESDGLSKEKETCDV